ncbi:2-oxoacid dehydrogenase acyltransferase [Macleaya cordata]|uniref:2-oxoacid dehydrogenase acyltransferase n=1 Tax=Macleaya cordata TaxID=56857 RepID=A0A200QD73_MACCD|nr:2-oxoacid dehydrogenase acyltransferase [Macleaya cordata]
MECIGARSNITAMAISPCPVWRSRTKRLLSTNNSSSYSHLIRRYSFSSLQVKASNGGSSTTESFSVSVKEGGFVDEEDYIKSGGSEILFVQMQQTKPMDEQVKISDKLPPISIGDSILDVVIIGCGPAGLSLAAEAAKLGLQVGLIGPDLPFTNNYGVWEDEFKDLGLEGCIEHVWKDTIVYLDSDDPILIGRAYGRVSRQLLYEELLRRCVESGVSYLNSKVERIIEAMEGHSLVACESGIVIPCRLATVASGAASGKLLQYEVGGPRVSVQTAYGLEVEVENNPYDPSLMVFMDYRDYMKQKVQGLEEEYPSFLYAMPMSPTRVFFEETCLASRNAIPFDQLKKKLMSRLKTMGIRVIKVYEEEWSYIPVGGSLPNTEQKNLAFGAAASMVHPATGYSVVRSLSEAPKYASVIAKILKQDVYSKHAVTHEMSTKNISILAWNTLWPQERKRQRAFFLFGLELILQLDIEGIRTFFQTFFRLPNWMWKGFLGSSLSSTDLLLFALYMFILAPNSMRMCLVRHLLSDPTGATMCNVSSPPASLFSSASSWCGWRDRHNGNIYKGPDPKTPDSGITLLKKAPTCDQYSPSNQCRPNPPSREGLGKLGDLPRAEQSRAERAKKHFSSSLLRDVPKLLRNEPATLVRMFSKEANPCINQGDNLLKIRRHGYLPGKRAGVSVGGTPIIVKRGRMRMGNRIVDSVFNNAFPCSQVHPRRGFFHRFSRIFYVFFSKVIAVTVEEEDDIANFKDYKPSSSESGAAVKGPSDSSPPKKEVEPVSSSEPAVSVAVEPPQSGDRPFASPLARKLAKDNNVPLSRIKGTGPDGHIVKADIDEYLASSGVSAPVSKAKDTTKAATLDYTDLPHSQIRKVTASRLLHSKQTIPHYYLTVDTCVDKLMDLKNRLNFVQEASGGKRISVNDLVVKAAALALRKFPQCNSSWKNDYIRQYNNVNINVAVQTENGLFVPVIRNADKKGLSIIGEEVKQLAEKARGNSLKLEDYEGGTFTVSNLGGPFGIKQFCAIINPPQSGILAVGSAEKKVVPGVAPDQLKFASFMSVALSCDHRVIDGAIGAEWLKAFKGYIENPESMLL